MEGSAAALEKFASTTVIIEVAKQRQPSIAPLHSHMTLRGRHALGQKILAAPLCFALGTTHVEVLAGRGLPKSCPKKRGRTEVSAVVAGSAGATGRHETAQRNCSEKKLT